MATDYSKLKNAELEALLKERDLPHAGKKAEMVARLVEHDAQAAKANTKAPAPTTDKPAPKSPVKAAAPPPAAAAAAKVSTEPAAAAIAAGGQERAKNPMVVPNQAPAVDPSTTDDLTVAKDGEPAPAADAEASTTTSPAVDTFASNLPATSLEAELAKRKARALKFGIEESDADALKALERTKRFGTGAAADGAAVARLDQALPERRGKKRGSDAGVADNGFADPALKRRRGEAPARGRGGRKDAPRARSSTPKAAGDSKWMSEKDRAAAEARKAKWATPAASTS